MFYVLAGFVWLQIVETIYPSNFRTSQPVDDLGGRNPFANCNAYIESNFHASTRTFRTHKIYLGQFRKHPS